MLGLLELFVSNLRRETAHISVPQWYRPPPNPTLLIRTLELPRDSTTASSAKGKGKLSSHKPDTSKRAEGSQHPRALDSGKGKGGTSVVRAEVRLQPPPFHPTHSSKQRSQHILTPSRPPTSKKGKASKARTKGMSAQPSEPAVPETIAVSPPDFAKGGAVEGRSRIEVRLQFRC